MPCNVAAYSACTTVLEGDVSKARREASVEWWKKITEAVQKVLGWSSENKLAKEENDSAKLLWCTETWKTNTEEIDKINEDVDRLPTTSDELQVEITQISRCARELVAVAIGKNREMTELMAQTKTVRQTEQSDLKETVTKKKQD